MHINTAMPRAAWVIPLGPLALLGALLLVLLAALLAPSLWLGGLATLIWLVLVGRAFMAHTAITALLAPFLIIHFSVMLSLLAIEGGAFMKEIGQHGAPSLASVLYPMTSLLFIGTAIVGHAVLLRRCPPAPRPAPAELARRPAWLACAGLGLGLLAVLWLTTMGLKDGFPLLSGQDRFQYRASANPITLNLLNLKVVISAALGTGALAARATAPRRAHHAVFGLYVLTSFLFGDKFFNILTSCAVYATPMVLAAPALARASVGKALPPLAVLLAAVLAVTTYIYSNYGELSVADTLERLSERVAGQGQLWWVAVRDNSVWLAFDSAALQGNLASLLANPAATYVFEHRLVAFYFVERYAPAAMHLSFLHNGGTVTPTMLFEAYSLVLAGGVGLVCALLAAGAWAGVLLGWLHRSMLQGNVFNVLLPAYVLTQTFYLMAQGTLYALLSLSAVKAYAAFLVLQLAVRAVLRLRDAPTWELRHG